MGFIDALPNWLTELLKYRSERQVLLRQVGLEAWDARRELRAGFEHHSNEPSQTVELIEWARHVAKGFPQLEKRFETLKQLAAKAPRQITDAILDARTDFNVAAGIINQVLRPGVRGYTVEISLGTDDNLRPAYARMRACLKALDRAMDDELGRRPDGYPEI